MIKNHYKWFLTEDEKMTIKCMCGAKAPYVRNMTFNKYKIDGWKCKKCKEIYYEPIQAQKILLLNKLKKEKVKAKLGRIRSNLILRLPKNIEFALGLKQGEKVLLEIEGKNLKMIPA